MFSDNSVATFDGRTWSSPMPTDPPPYYRNSVSCVDAGHCFVVGGRTAKHGGLSA